MRDSGGMDPQGNGINILCELCKGSGYIDADDLEKPGGKTHVPLKRLVSHIIGLVETIDR